MRLTEQQLKEFLGHNPNASDLFNMCKESVPTSEFRASLEALLQDARDLPTLPEPR